MKIRAWNPQTCSGFYPSTFLQPVNGSKNSILNWVLKLNLFKFLQVFFFFFFKCLSRKTLDRFFILLYLFLLYKPHIFTKQTALTNRFVIPRTNLCSCIQKIKNKQDCGTDFFFFLFTYPCVTRSIVRDWLCYLVTKTKTLGTKKHNS